MQNQIAQFGGDPYARLIQLGKEAQKVGLIKGILMHQGESNTGQSTWPTAVKCVYESILTDLGLESNKTPLLVGELACSDEGGKCGSHNGDGLHITSAAYREFGARYAKKVGSS